MIVVSQAGRGGGRGGVGGAGGDGMLSEMISLHVHCIGSCGYLLLRCFIEEEGLGD